MYIQGYALTLLVLDMMGDDEAEVSVPVQESEEATEDDLSSRYPCIYFTYQEAKKAPYVNSLFVFSIEFS